MTKKRSHKFYLRVFTVISLAALAITTVSGAPEKVQLPIAPKQRPKVVVNSGPNTDPTLPAPEAGSIPAAKGKIAFIREGDIWTMSADGSGQTMVCDVDNASGRLSWSADNEEILFTRQGEVKVSNPDGLGGAHKVYDLFRAILDSAKSYPKFWNRVTEDLGSRNGEWSRDGETILFHKDLSANTVTALFPNYQICVSNPYGGKFEILRKDYEAASVMCVYPTRGPNDAIAFNIFFDQKPQGIVMLDDMHAFPTDAELKTKASSMAFSIAPSWSPDGKWIAYVVNDMTRSAVYITAPDKSRKFLVYRPASGRSVAGITPGWSPDSKWLTFGLDNGSIWICDITGKQAKGLIPAGDNRSPAWSK